MDEKRTLHTPIRDHHVWPFLGGSIGFTTNGGTIVGILYVARSTGALHKLNIIRPPLRKDGNAIWYLQHWQSALHRTRNEHLGIPQYFQSGNMGCFQIPTARVAGITERQQIHRRLVCQLQNATLTQAIEGAEHMHRSCLDSHGLQVYQQCVDRPCGPRMRPELPK